MNNGMINTYVNVCGLDIHKSDVWAHIRDFRGVILETTFKRTTEDLVKLQQCIQTNHVSAVIMESTNTYWRKVYETLIEVVQCVVVNAHHLKELGKHKTDERDANLLARCYMCNLIRYSFVPSKDIYDLRQLTRKRTDYVKRQTSIVNQLKSRLEGNCPGITTHLNVIRAVFVQEFLRKWGTSTLSFAEFVKQVEPGQSRRALERREEELLPFWDNPPRKTVLFLLQEDVELYAIYETKIEQITTVIYDLVAREEELRTALKRLVSIPGIGKLTAITVIAEYGTVNRFDTGTAAAASCGLTPRLKGSGGKTRSGHITKHGPSNVRRVLYIAAKNIIQRSDKYKAIFLRIKERRGGRIALVAIARKLAELCWLLWSKDVSYSEQSV